MTKLKTNICIVGAGPAGITASLFLSKFKMNHILVEKGVLPQDKVCGETFLGRVIPVLKEIDPNLQQELLDSNIIALSNKMSGLWYPEEKKIDLNFSRSYKYPFIKAKRKWFDYSLLKKALESEYVTYIDNCYINDYTNNKSGIILENNSGTLKIEAQIVILCIGEQIKKLSHLFGNYSTLGIEFLAARQYFSNPTYDTTSFNSEIHYFKKPVAYTLYTTRLPNNEAMVEIVMEKKEAKKINYQLVDCLNSSIFQSASLKKRFANADVIGKAQGKSFLLGTYPRKLSAERFLLAGSAIGSIHIFSGLGVGHAMRSGQLAAYWANQAVLQENQSANFLKQYDKAIKQRFKLDFFYAKVYLLTVKYPKLFIALARPIFSLLKRTIAR